MKRKHHARLALSALLILPIAFALASPATAGSGNLAKAAAMASSGVSKAFVRKQIRRQIRRDNEQHDDPMIEELDDRIDTVSNRIRALDNRLDTIEGLAGFTCPTDMVIRGFTGDGEPLCELPAGVDGQQGPIVLRQASVGITSSDGWTDVVSYCEPGEIAIGGRFDTNYNTLSIPIAIREMGFYPHPNPQITPPPQVDPEVPVGYGARVNTNSPANLTFFAWAFCAQDDRYFASTSP